jgi:aminoethylphosphonate catabolism LysR family transcriptional regulator
MNLHHLRIFHTVAATGSFTGAARRLGISQPAVTIQVRELEENSGVQLLERRARRLRLTPAGQALLRVSERIFALADEAEAVLAQAGGAVSGTLRISASGSAGAYLLPPVLTRFHRRYPGVHVQLEISNSRRVLDQVLGFEADLGALGAPDGTTPVGPADDARLVLEPFAREPLRLVLAPRHAWAGRRRVSVADLADQPLILREPGSATRRVLERHLDQAGVTPRIVMELGSNEAIKHAVAAGVGLALLGARVVAHEVADHRLAAVRLREAAPALRFFFVYHADRAHAAVLRAFLRLARPPHRGGRHPG